MLQNTTVSREQNGELWKDIICVYFEVHLWHFRGHFRGLTSEEGHMAAQVFEALRYKPQGRGFDSKWVEGSGVYKASNRNKYQR